jgi:hypothetical protein
MPRKAHKYHYIYKTTCNVTGKYYIGMHSTSNLEDGYMGSGKRLRRSLIKHGIENHTVEILEFLEDRKFLAEREKEIVNQELLNEPLCMNLKIGGEGGSGSQFLSKNQLSLGGKNSMKILWESNDFRESHKIRMINQNKNLHKDGKIKPPTFSGKTHSEESKQKMRESSKGKGTTYTNSQFGTCWINNGTENMKIRKGDSIPEGWSLGRKLKNNALDAQEVVHRICNPE